MVGQKPLIQETVKDRGLPRGSGSAIRDWVRWFGQGQFSKVVLGWTDEGVCHYMVGRKGKVQRSCALPGRPRAFRPHVFRSADSVSCSFSDISRSKVQTFCGARHLCESPEDS